MLLVVGVDGSEGSLRALRRALRLAAWLDGSVHAVHVVHHSPAVIAALEGAPIALEEIERKEREAVWAEVDRVVAECGGPNPERVELGGYPPDAIADYAKQVGADLVVVGHRGLGAFRALLVGSTSQRILHVAECDVLVVKGETA